MSETQLSEGGHVLVRGTLELTDEYKEIKQIVEIGGRLQVQLGLIENPRYTWSIFPEWKEKIEAASSQKEAYMAELENNVEMHYELIHHNYRFQLRNMREEVGIYKEKIKKLNACVEELEDQNRELERKISILRADEGQGWSVNDDSD